MGRDPFRSSKQILTTKVRDELVAMSGNFPSDSKLVLICRFFNFRKNLTSARRVWVLARLMSLSTRIDAHSTQRRKIRKELVWIANSTRMHAHNIPRTKTYRDCHLLTYRSLKTVRAKEIADFAEWWDLIKCYCSFYFQKWPKNAIFARFWHWFQFCLSVFC